MKATLYYSTLVFCRSFSHLNPKLAFNFALWHSRGSCTQQAEQSEMLKWRLVYCELSCFCALLAVYLESIIITSCWVVVIICLDRDRDKGLSDLEESQEQRSSITEFSQPAGTSSSGMPTCTLLDRSGEWLNVPRPETVTHLLNSPRVHWL